MNFMTTLNSFIMTYLDPFGIIIGLILAIPIFGTWIILLRQTKQKKKIWEQARKSTGNQPAVLIINLLPGKDISTNILQFVNDDEALKEIQKERIITLVWKNQQLEPGEMTSFAMQLRNAISDIYKTGADRIHLFYAGPYTAATVIGSELSNNLPTTLYQYNSITGKYENFGPLKLVI